MSTFQKNFEALIAERKIPAKYREISDGHHLYFFSIKLTKSRDTGVEIIIQNSDDKCVDVQIVYRNIHVLGQYEKRAQALEFINELNEMKTGYYTLHLAGDGEIFLRNLIRVNSTDVVPFYETLIAGTNIAAALVSDLVEKLGESAKIA